MSTEETLKQQIIEKAWQDEAFKQELLANPAEAVKRAFNLEIPEGIQLSVVEETPSHFYLVLPQNPKEQKSLDSSTEAYW